MISKRLMCLASLIKGRKIIDVGADHGELEVYLIENDLADKIIAIENKIGPYNILSKKVSSLKNVETSLSDGIEKITDDIDTIVIAGMGGILIRDILNKDKDKLTHVKQVVVDAHRDNYLIRKYMTSNGFAIEREVIVKEKDIYYFVISFIKGSQTISESELLYGYKTNKDSLWKDYKAYEEERLSSLYSKNHLEETLLKKRRLDEHEHD